MLRKYRSARFGYLKFDGDVRDAKLWSNVGWEVDLRTNVMYTVNVI